MTVVGGGGEGGFDVVEVGGEVFVCHSGSFVILGTSLRGLRNLILDALEDLLTRMTATI